MQRARPAPLVMVLGMMNSRAPAISRGLPRPGRQALRRHHPREENAHPAAVIAAGALAAGIDAEAGGAVSAALRAAAAIPGARVVICGSLYLAGHVLHRNGTPPR